MSPVGQVKGRGERIVIYGEGGVGKSSLASLAPAPVFMDLQSGAKDLKVRRVSGASTLLETREALNTHELWRDCKTIVIDDGTTLQKWCSEHVCATVKHPKSKPIKSIEDYDFGKGLQFIYDHFLLVLGDLDNHARQGRNVILICHQTVEKAPNPDGEDFLRYEPSLQQPPRAGQLRSFVRDWCDHILFIQLDKTVKDGRAEGGGSRTIWPQSRPTYWAKSKTLRDPVVFTDPDADPEKAGEVWRLLGLK